MRSIESLPKSFVDFYATHWGERTPAILNALMADELKTVRKSAFSDFAIEQPPVWQEWPELSSRSQDKAHIGRGGEGLLGYYVMDPASYWIARWLNVQPGDDVLDMCAAPGGKSLVIIEALASGDGRAVLNEVSQTRRDRLITVVQQYVPREVRERVRVAGKDGGLYAKSHANTFDRVLVDAPCSGERHLLQSKPHMAEWNDRISRSLAQRQYALLTAAWLTLKPGGRLVYSTCSLSKTENDQVIEKFLKKLGKKDEPVTICEDPLFGAEKTKYGFQYLPDISFKTNQGEVSGIGPLYACALDKI